MDLFTLGKNIQKARHVQGFSGEELAELCNISPAYLRQLEAGRKTPSLPRFVTICNVLKVSPSYLLIGNAVDYYCDSPEILIELTNASSPDQLKLITAIIKTALNEL